MHFILTLAGMVGFLAFYIFVVRPHFKKLETFKDVFDYEETRWEAIKTWAQGRKVILIGMWGEMIAFAPDVLNAVSGMDLRTILHLPDAWAAIITGIIPILMIIARTKSLPPSDDSTSTV